MDDFIFIVIFVLGIIGFAVISLIEAGESNGRVQVASGQWKCELTQQPDKTNKWKCLEVEINE